MAVILLIAGIPLTVAWFTNLGPVRWWHLAGPALILAAVWIADRVRREIDAHWEAQQAARRAEILERGDR